MKKKVLGLISILIIVVLMFTAKKEISNFNATKSQAETETTMEITRQGLVITADGLVAGGGISDEIMKENTEYLQQCIDQISETGGGTVQIPAGTYYFSAQENKQYIIKCKNNVLIKGSGNDENTGTILKPHGQTTYGIDMFYYNEYADSNYTNSTYLINADFKNFVIDANEANGQNYNLTGKGFNINLYQNCEWDSITVKNTDGTGFGMNCPINSTIKNCVAIGCGKNATTEDDGASGFEIGIGFSDNEYIYINNCTANNNKKYGIVFEHQAKYEKGTYTATKSDGFIVTDSNASGNMYDFGGNTAYDVVYENCISGYGEETNTATVRAYDFKDGNSIRTYVRKAGYNVDYTDLDGANSHSVYWADENGITFRMNKTKFLPNEDTTRAQTVLWLYRLEGRPGALNLSDFTTGFSDIDDDELGKDLELKSAINWAIKRGLIEEPTEEAKTFRPEEGITRRDFIVMLWKFAGSHVLNNNYHFPDCENDEELQNALDWGAYVEIIFYDGQDYFHPSEVCTREDGMYWLWRLEKNCLAGYDEESFEAGITYYLQGGKATIENPTTYDNHDDPITLNNPTKEGYTFKGWIGKNYTTDENGGTYCEPLTNLTHDDSETGFKVYTAIWKPNAYSIIFNANNGTGEVDQLYYSYDNPQALLKNEFTREGYVFTGWNTAADGTGTTYTDGQIVNNLTVNANEIISLYAQWERRYSVEIVSTVENAIDRPLGIVNQYEEGEKVELQIFAATGWENLRIVNELPFLYNATEESEGVLAISFVMPAEDVVIEVAADEIKYTQYTVEHYKQNIDGTYPQTPSEPQTIDGKIGDEISPEVKTYEGFTSPEVQTVELTEDGQIIKYYYERNSYGVDIFNRGGVKDQEIRNHKYGEEVIVPLELEKGWENNIHVSIKNDGVTFEWIDNERIKFIMPATNVVIEVSAQPIIYSITYNLNEGTAEKNPTTYNVMTNDFTLNQPTRQGFIFLGWTGSNGEEPQKEVKIEKGTTGNLEYIANWQRSKVQYKVEHYKQNIDGTYPQTPSVTDDELEEIIGSQVTGEVDSYEGFTAPEIQTITLSENAAENVIRYEYTRNSYNVEITKGTGIDQVTGAGSYKYEQEVTLGATVQEGYDENSIIWTKNGESVESTFTMLANDVQINVNATPITYTIAYNLDGGTVEGNPTTYTVETPDIELKAPTKEGYEFLGWTGSNGEERQKEVTITEGTTGNLTYTANWKNVTTQYTVEHYKQKIDGTYETTSEESERMPAMIGAQVKGVVHTYVGFTSPVEQTIILKENAAENVIKYYYTRNSYNVKITKGTGIERISEDAQYKYGEQVTLQASLKDGYKNVTWTGDYNSNEFTMPARNVQMNVSAELIEYEITYNLNGGKFEGEGNPPVYTIESEDITIESPTRVGYTFIGWTWGNVTTPEKEVTIEQGTTGNLEFTANWKVIPTDEPDDLEVEISYSTKEPTNKNVTVIISANNKIKPVVGWTLSEDGKSISKVYEENVKGTVTIVDEYGNEKEQPFEVTNIDKIPPKITLEYIKLENGVKVIATADEELQEIDGWELAEDKKVMTKIYYVDKEEEVTFVDLAGNETKKPIKVEIEKDSNEGDGNGNNAGAGNNNNGNNNAGNTTTDKDTTNGNKTDTTTANKVIPAAGLKFVMGIGMIITAIGAISFAKMKKYKDIK